MGVKWGLLAGGLAVALTLAATPAGAAPRVDQRCAPAKARTGYYGGPIAQSFTPTAATVGRVDLLLMSTRDVVLDPIRLRIVGQRVVVDGAAVQLTVLAEQRVRVVLREFRPTCVSMRLKQPLAWASAGPAVAQYAVEVGLPFSDDAVFWIHCDGYARGQAYADVDPGSVASRDTGTALGVAQPRDMAFAVYSTTR